MSTAAIIAVVDDDASVRAAMRRLLRSFDFGVELYGTGRDLLAAPSLGQISCVITDVQMPDMSGFALSDALRARGVPVPVILMTAFTQEGYEARAQAMGIAGFLNKPFEADEIIRCIERALGRQG